MRKPIIAGNWKMHKTAGEGAKLVQELNALTRTVTAVEIVVCPPFTALTAVAAAVAGTNIGLGAQNMHWEDKGAFTGEIAPGMLKDIGCTHVIIGHSERRQYFAETDQTVNKKLKAAFTAGLKPIMCVGETLAEREAKATEQVVGAQVKGALEGLNAEQVAGLVIAYEPVWAIGTGRTASAEDANAVCAFIRRTVGELFGSASAESVRIQYGGSVKPDNVAELMAKPDIDGALVGGASLEADSFSKLVKFK
ncbi:triose-phosphate isomerase [Sporomusa acidovorans]|uniref:Triosephosphate isomerase n=1 Tax=Sporomusa acidovorans (strain ATCC 49682 / DSM 3132 / Mol) TaxID=1123286 RepID=A0ABZ3J7C2_SPOA4|nr:triose-phosphate isomerase [Sporomusa acidovorans]OZC24057.1 triosephosphate isomerase [Sporomusa acidovorans DSM 3132]SDF59258.1 triosephosphate isomerase [Sporomusa acidovorans]